MLKRFFIIAGIFVTGALMLPSIVFATAISSTATGGNWNTGGTWVGGVVPGSADAVTIVNNATVTVDTATAAEGMLKLVEI